MRRPSLSVNGLPKPDMERSPPKSVRCATSSTAEDYHQQYLAKNPGGYCPVHATGVSCPVGLLRQDQVPAQTDILPPSE